ncbi:MAG TPA: apolipoprotein N-acyltransferase, partial [Desulfobacterales bacterium]|nr:apolipoprotein N-acyltransferase [Desulfobacterales bacterium]
MALFLLSKTSLPQRPTRLGPFCYIGAVTSGLMLTAAFPPPGFSWLAWIAFVPLFKAIEGQGPKEGIKLGLIFGLVHFGTLLYWIVYVASHYGRLNLWLSTFPFLLLICYLAIYPVAFCGLWSYLQRGNLGFLTIPFTWTALEFLRAKLLTGFPWCLVGYSQFKNLILIQLASLTGVYGLSFLIVLANFSIFQITVARTKGKMATHLFPLLITLLAIGTALGYGNSVLSGDDSKAKGQALGVLVVQPNIDQSQKWNPSFQEATIQLLETLTRKGATPGLDLIVWPETAIPFFFQENGKLSGQIRALSKQLEVPIIFGSPAYEDSPNGRRYFNRAY